LLIERLGVLNDLRPARQRLGFLDVGSRLPADTPVGMVGVLEERCDGANVLRVRQLVLGRLRRHRLVTGPASAGPATASAGAQSHVGQPGAGGAYSPARDPRAAGSLDDYRPWRTSGGRSGPAGSAPSSRARCLQSTSRPAEVLRLLGRLHVTRVHAAARRPHTTAHRKRLSNLGGHQRVHSASRSTTRHSTGRTAHGTRHPATALTSKRPTQSIRLAHRRRRRPPMPFGRTG
jgi:hypothetical protein